MEIQSNPILKCIFTIFLWYQPFTSILLSHLENRQLCTNQWRN